MNPSTEAFTMPNVVKHYADQHGRLWRWTVDKLSDAPVGYPAPEGWDAPWLPPVEFMRVIAPENGRNRVEIDYDGFIQSRREADGEYQTGVRKLMQRTMGAEYDPNMAPTPAVLDIAGPPPQSYLPAAAAKAGNRWVLFGEGTMPSRLAPAFAVQQAKVAMDDPAYWEDAEDEAEVVATAPVKRGPGRPRKHPVTDAVTEAA